MNLMKSECLAKVFKVITCLIFFTNTTAGKWNWIITDSLFLFPPLAFFRNGLNTHSWNVLFSSVLAGVSFCQSTCCKKQSGPVDRAIIFNPQFIHHSRPEMYKINVVQLLCRASATRVVLFSVPNRRLWLDVFVLLCACGMRTLFYTPVRPFVPLFQIHYRPIVTVQLRANFLSLALSLPLSAGVLAKQQ